MYYLYKLHDRDSREYVGMYTYEDLLTYIHTHPGSIEDYDYEYYQLNLFSAVRG